MKHETLEDAIHGEFDALIPSSFVHVDENGKERNISIGEISKNEILKAGESATQGPQEYIFQTASSIVHLIDTPGIGDVRGTWQDKENFDNILSFLLNYEKINAVCVLLKPNNSRLTVSFRFCVLELLTHLHKSLEKNLLFCFTNSRSTFYRPGDTMPVLKKLLADNNIDVALDNSRYFCFDNEAFRFLACLKNRVEFDDDEKEMFSKSWEKTLKTTEKLFECVRDLPPHKTKNTLSMNEARNIILALTKPMAEIVQLIDDNKRKVKSVKKQITLAQGDISKFEKSLKFSGFELERENLDYPITVCAHADCKKFVSVGKTKINNTIYPTICHEHCTIKGLPTETTNDERLAKCLAFDFRTSSAKEKFFGKPVTQFPGYRIVKEPIKEEGRDIFEGELFTYDYDALKKSLTPAKREELEHLENSKYNENCWRCNHSYKQHMHITYTTKIVEKEFLSEEVQREIKSKKDFKAKHDTAVKSLTKTIQELKEEKEFLMTCAIKFSSFQ